MLQVAFSHKAADGDANAGVSARCASSLLVPTIAMLAAIALLRTIALHFNATELFVDEAQYWSWSLEPSFGYFSKPPLIAWIIAGATPVCGFDEVCVRLPSVLLHAGTGLLVFLIGRRLYSDFCGFVAAAAYATLPGVSLSSGVISTDVPLMFCWALALWAFVCVVARPSWAMSVMLGLAFGLGLNAKYAMAYFLLCAALCFYLMPERRPLLARPHLWAAVAIGFALITPNLIWNATHGFATFAHTAENARWSGSFFHPGKAVEFLASQFGVFGPILFGALIVVLWRARLSLPSLPESDRVLLAFSVPVIALVTVQAFLSRAHANWAAAAYVAAVVLVTGVMLREKVWRWMTSSLAINATLAVVIAIATWKAGTFELPGLGDPFQRTLGNQGLAAAVKDAVAQRISSGEPVRSIVADDREGAAALLYYARDLEIPILSLGRPGAPRNHFELTRPFTGAAEQQPALLIAHPETAREATAPFASVNALGRRDILAGKFTRRAVEFFAVSGYGGR